MKTKICLFMRKPFFQEHFSIENIYYELFSKFRSKNIEIVFKVCPLKSKGILSRFFLCFWAYFNQGDINHVTGDINFISIFFDKNKTITTIHDCYGLKRLKGIKYYFYLIFWIRLPIFKSNKIIVVSSKVKKELLKYIDIKYKDKIRVIHNFASKKFKKKKLIKNKKYPNILIIGTAKNKNLDKIIGSLKKIKCKVTIIGQINKKIKQKLVNTNIVYENFVSLSQKNLIKIYNKSTLLLYPSKYEGFGLPILEAQSVGLPVITSNLEPMRTVAGNGAYLVNPNSIKEISISINKILSNRMLSSTLIKRGYMNIKRFNKSLILSLYLKTYKEVLNFI